MIAKDTIDVGPQKEKLCSKLRPDESQCGNVRLNLGFGSTELPGWKL